MIVVSAHCMLRYLERVVGIETDDIRRSLASNSGRALDFVPDEWVAEQAAHLHGIDLAAIREGIKTIAARGVEAGASAVTFNGWRFVLAPSRRTVVTVTERYGGAKEVRRRFHCHGSDSAGRRWA